MGAPSRERLVLLHAWPDGNFFEKTRGSQRVDIKEMEVMINEIRKKEKGNIFCRLQSKLRINANYFTYLKNN